MFSLDFVILGNSLQDWLVFVAVSFVAFVVLKIFKVIIVKKLKLLSKKTETQLDDMVFDAIDSLHLPFYVFSSIFIATFFVAINNSIEKIILYVFLISSIYYVIKFLEKLVDYGVEKIIDGKEGREGEGIIKLGGSVVKIVLRLGAVISVLSNMGYDVTSLIAGLGIGGLAVALALQSILSDLFSSLTIMMDRPFKIGDFIILGDKSGTVKNIGIKSTRIELLQGEELIVSNSELTKAQIRNYGIMKKRRMTFNLGIVYGTSSALLEKIPVIIQEIIESEENTNFSTSRFTEFGDFSLNFYTIYYINSGDYKESIKTAEQINLKIIKKFEEEKIEFAFPTQTLHIEK